MSIETSRRRSITNSWPWLGETRAWSTWVSGRLGFWRLTTRVVPARRCNTRFGADARVDARRGLRATRGAWPWAGGARAARAGVVARHRPRTRGYASAESLRTTGADNRRGRSVP